MTTQLFLSWARKNQTHAQQLWGMLETALEAAAPGRFTLWSFDRCLLAGDRFDDRIKEALDEAPIGVLGCSSAFFASRYINEIELPHYVNHPTKRLVPVQLEPWPSGTSLGGLADYQIHGNDRSFIHCTSRPQKVDFVNGLAEAVIAAADQLGHQADGELAQEVEA